MFTPNLLLQENCDIKALVKKFPALIDKYIGVVKDFHMESLHNKIIPLYIKSEPSRFQYISIKVTPENSHETMMFLQEKWTEFDPTQPVNSLLLDEYFSDKYMPEKIVFKIISYFTFLALFIAWPLAYLAMNQWLQNFAFRTNIGLGTFILAGVLALVIALLTVGYQAIKAARANPVDSLRYE